MRGRSISAALAATVLLVPACGGATDDEDNTTEEATETSFTDSESDEEVLMPDVVGMDLQDAQDEIQDAGAFFSRSEDATGQGRRQVFDRNWVVVDQEPAPGAPIEERDPLLYVVKDGETLDSTTTTVESSTTTSATTTGPATTTTPPATAAAPPPTSTSAPPTTTTTTPAPATWMATSITDGDTLDVTGPEGNWTVRLIGINAPESGECFADEATDALEALTDGDLTLISDVSDVDQFGRKLRFIETADGRDIGAELVRGGYAISRRYDPDTSRNATYEAIQAEAEASQVGLWAPDACGPAATEVSIDLDIRYDADGNDNENKNDEWVRFTNTSSGPLDLDGWVVADESASHRYTFRGLALDPGAAVTLYTGCGDDSDTERYWCNQQSAVWNNSGDTVFLRDPNGNNVIAETYQGN